MLKEMRQHSRSFVIYIFFGIIIAVFVVNFGPQSAGCSSSVSYAGRVLGQPITQTIFNYILTATRIRSLQIPEPQMVQRRGAVMDALLLREIMADEALRIGFRISDKEIDDMIVNGRFLVLGQTQPLIRDDDGNFDYDLLSRYVKYSWGINVLQFKDEQRRELLAEKTREYLQTQVKVSEDEVHASFNLTNTQVDLSYVRFSPTSYRSKVQIDDAKVTTYLTANEKKVKEYYDKNQSAFNKRPKQLKLQAIEIAISNEEQKDAARQKAEAILKRLQSGEDFAKVAATESDDQESRSAGGNLGWRNQDSAGYDPETNKVIAQLKKDQLSTVLGGQGRFLIVKAIGQREGDLSFEQTKQDIATDLYRSEQSTLLAKADAAEFIKRAKAGEKLEDIFTTDTPPADDAEQANLAQEKGTEEKGTEEKSTEEKGTDEKTIQEKSAEEGAKPPKSPLKLASTSFFSRSGRHLIPGIGESKELTDLAFQLKKGAVADQPFEVEQIVYLVGCKDRKDPDAKEWTDKKEELTEQYRAKKWYGVLRDYAYTHCRKALEDKKLYVNQQALITPGYVPDKNAMPLPTYIPCDSMKERPF